MRVCLKVAIIFIFSILSDFFFFFFTIMLICTLLNSEIEVSTIPFLQTWKPRLRNGIGSTPTAPQCWDQSASLLDLAGRPCLLAEPRRLPSTRGRGRLHLF